MPTTRASIALVMVAGILFGTAGTASALGPASAPPIAVGILRIQVGALALLAAMPFLGADLRRLPVLWRRPGVLVAALGSGLYQPLFFASVAQSGVALGTLVTVGSEPALAGVLGWLVLRHRPTKAWVAATLVAVVGLVLRSWTDLGSGDAMGLLFALGAGLCSALYIVGAKWELDRGATALEIPTAAFLAGGLLLVPLLATQPLAWVAQPDGLAVVLYLGVATMAIANVLHTRGLHGLSPGPTATLMLTDPVVATLLGVIVLGETVGPLALAGVALVLAGIALQGLAVARSDPGDLEPAPVL